MTELEQLKQQKKEIEARIKELTTTDIVCGKAKFWKDSHPGAPNYNYLVSVHIPIKTLKTEFKQEEYKYGVVCKGETKEDLINNLKEIIQDLRDLHRKLVVESET